MLTPTIKHETLDIITVRVTAEELNAITETSGFDLLYDYEYFSPRIVKVADIVDQMELAEDDHSDAAEFLRTFTLGAERDQLVRFIPKAE
jgi:hypothetical protein